MNRFRVIYNYIILSIGLVLGGMYLSKMYLGISFINDGIYACLLILIPLMIIFYPYYGGFGMALLSLLWRGAAAYVLLSIVVLIMFNQSGVLAAYAVMHSPNEQRQIVIKQYVTGIHHFTNHIEMYKKVGWLFKKDIKQGIHIDEDQDEMGWQGRVNIANGSRFKGQTEYIIDNRLIFKWVDEDNVDVYLGVPQKDGIKDINKEITINLANN